MATKAPAKKTPAKRAPAKTEEPAKAEEEKAPPAPKKKSLEERARALLPDLDAAETWAENRLALEIRNIWPDPVEA